MTKKIISFITCLIILVTMSASLVACVGDTSVKGYVYVYDDFSVLYGRDYDGERLTDEELEQGKENLKGATVIFKEDGTADMSAARWGISGTIHGRYVQSGDTVVYTAFLAGDKFTVQCSVLGNRLYVIEQVVEGVETRTVYKRSGVFEEEASREPDEITENSVVGTYKFLSMQIKTSYMTLDYGVDKTIDGFNVSESAVVLKVMSNNYWSLRSSLDSSMFFGWSWGVWEIMDKRLDLQEIKESDIESATVCEDVMTISTISEDGAIVNLNLKKEADVVDQMPFEYISDVLGYTFVFSDVEVVEGNSAAVDLDGLRAYYAGEKIEFGSKVEAFVRDGAQYGYAEASLDYEQDGNTVQIKNRDGITLEYTLKGFTLEYVAPADEDGVRLKYVYNVMPKNKSVVGHTYEFNDTLIPSNYKEYGTLSEVKNTRAWYTGMKITFNEDGTFSVTKSGSVVTDGTYESDEDSLNLLYSKGGNTFVYVWGSNLVVDIDMDNKFVDTIFVLSE